MGRFVRRTIRMMIISVSLGVAMRIAQQILEHRAGVPGGQPVRTGSFDSWPTVPPAPGRQATGA